MQEITARAIRESAALNVYLIFLSISQNMEKIQQQITATFNFCVLTM